MYQCSTKGFCYGTPAAQKNTAQNRRDACCDQDLSSVQYDQYVFTDVYCMYIWCTGLVTYGLKQSVSRRRQSLRWVGLKTSDAWLRGPGSSNRRLLLLCVYVCVYVCMWVWFGGPEGLCGAIPAGVSGKTLWSDKSSSVPCSISVCCLGYNTL